MPTLAEVVNSRMAEMNINQRELAERTGAIQQSISALRSGKVSNPTRWREIARELNIPEDEMRDLMMKAAADAGVKPRTRIPESARIKRGVPIAFAGGPALERRMPVLGRAVGGEDGEYIFNGEILDFTLCPPWLAEVEGAYGVFVDGESMVPRYMPGELVHVHPNRPPRRGDDVVVQIDGGDGDGAAPRGFIKAYVGYASDKLVLEQYNPPKKVEFDRTRVMTVHTIVSRMA